MSRDEGFTLVELLLVLMIIAVLTVIAIPSFFAVHQSAQDRAAQGELRNVALAEEAYWLEEGGYTETAADITNLMPNAVIADSPIDGVYIDLNVASSDVVCVVRTAESGNTFSIWRSSTGVTFYGDTDLSAADCPEAPPVGFTPDGF